MSDWVKSPIHQAIYALEQALAIFLWGFARAGLYIVDLIDRFRQNLLTRGFTQALDKVANETIGISRPVFELALVTGALLIISLPIIQLKWVNLKKAMLIAFLIPIGLPVLAAGFQDIDGARSNLADSLYSEVYNSDSFTMGVEGEQGADREMGDIRQSGYSQVRGVSVAAAYLFASRQDVIDQTELPTALGEGSFKMKYFRYPEPIFGDLDEARRWEQIRLSARGIMRMFYSIFLIAFAFFESLVNLGFTLTLGFLLIGFMLSLIFAMFTPFEGTMVNIIKKIADLFLQSWAISTVQALLLSALVNVAATGSGTAVLGMGVICLALQLLFTAVAYKAVIGAITGLGTSGGISTFEARGALAPIRAAAGGATAAATQTVGGTLDTMRAWGAARSAGANRREALGYAMSATRPMSSIGALATAMGSLSPDGDVGRGLYLGSVMGRGDPLSLRSIHNLHRDVARRNGDDAPAGVHGGTQRPAGALGLTPNRRIPPGENPSVPPYDAAAVSTAIARVAAAPPNVHAPPSTAVADMLGTPLGAFGKKARSVDHAVGLLQKHPLPAGVAQRLMLEATHEGGFSTPLRNQALGIMTNVHGVPQVDATKHMNDLESAMKVLPISISADPAQASVDHLMSQSPLLASHPALPAAPPAIAQRPASAHGGQTAARQKVAQRPAPAAATPHQPSPVMPTQRLTPQGSRPQRPKRGQGPPP
jgi:hypothetical protein